MKEKVEYSTRNQASNAYASKLTLIFNDDNVPLYCP